MPMHLAQVSPEEAVHAAERLRPREAAAHTPAAALLDFQRTAGNATVARWVEARRRVLARELSQETLAWVKKLMDSAAWGRTLDNELQGAIAEELYGETPYEHPQAELVQDLYSDVAGANGFLGAALDTVVANAKKFEDADVKAALTELLRLADLTADVGEKKGAEEDDPEGGTTPKELPPPTDPIWVLLSASDAELPAKKQKELAASATQKLIKLKEDLYEQLYTIVSHPAGRSSVPLKIEQAETRVFDIVSLLALRAMNLASAADPEAIFMFGKLVDCGFIDRLLYIRLVPRDTLIKDEVLCHHSDISIPLLEALQKLDVGGEKVTIPKSAGKSVPIDHQRFARLRKDYIDKGELATAAVAYAKSLKAAK